MSNPVQVFVRIKPRETDSPNSYSCKLVSQTQIAITNPRNAGEVITYSFDRVFGPAAQQPLIWDACRDTVKEALGGRNVTIFAYGQTGSGKTWTMNNNGIILRTVQELLKSPTAAIQASYLEIYNEKIFDLLAESNPGAGLDLRQNGTSMQVSGAIYAPVRTTDDFRRQQDLALRHRSTASTNLNQESSRSHYIVQLVVDSVANGRKVTAKVHLVDLAGSEDNKRTGNSGERLNESCAINKSLFVLGQVVEGLNRGQSRIPYRDSKITRFLQDSLGGNSLAVLVACCSQSESDAIDTYNTLNFAQKSSLIKNLVSVNETAVKEVENSSATRLKALEEWRRKKDLINGKKPGAEPVPADVGGLAVKRQPSSALALQLKRDLATEMAKEFESKMNSRVEEQVNARLKEITENMINTQIFQQAILEKFSQVQKRLDSKLELHDKENSHRQITPVKQGSAQEPDESPSFDALKESTNAKILHIINRGNVKTLMSLNTIGKKRAELILGYRDSNGEFACLDDLAHAGLKPSQISALFKANLDLS
ncbi:Kinesin-like protein kif22 [Kappamyces sp. JEL0829]|nr:Kinesin-like protein kif22 [Kappamyces sp. JEL0829]